jgi:hypothetical protein
MEAPFAVVAGALPKWVEKAEADDDADDGRATGCCWAAEMSKMVRACWNEFSSKLPLGMGEWVERSLDGGGWAISEASSSSKLMAS